MASDSFKGRLALVTGASRGIGRATALELAKAGAHVIAVARTQGGLEELDDEIKAVGGAATLVPLDMADHDSLDGLGAAIYERWGKIDIVVANAAILGPLTPLSHLGPKDWDKVVSLNVTAQWRLLRSMDPLLQRSEAGRVVMVTSAASWKNLAFWGGYSITKAALNALALTYAAETATTPIRINLFNPGPIRTAMRAQAMPGEDAMTLETPDGPAAEIVKLCDVSFTTTGQLFDYPDRRLKSLQFPA